MVDFEILPTAAETVVVPSALAVASPFEPVLLLMVATVVFVDVHVAESVMSDVELSENVPVAVNWRAEPIPAFGDAGVTAMETSVFTVNVVDPLTFSAALIVADPPALAVATPREPALLLMVAMLLFDELQTT